ncbi:MAG: NADH-quinone oxidoreductase subunit L [Acidobacteria bacterium]|nr:NADH-quinone oxidoreductase subunit L [Acidobacteriota bacterium]
MMIEELNEAAERERDRQNQFEDRILCCTVAGCHSCGSKPIRAAIAREIEAQGRQDEVELCGTGCLGLCGEGPLVKSRAANAIYARVQPGDAADLVAGRHDILTSKRVDNLPFYAGQHRLILSNSGVADPESVFDYIAAGGYGALSKTITEMEPNEVVEEIKRSGLRGRGGAGYPAGVKWELVARQNSPVKYVVCNADEGDPGAFMNRSVLEGDPHRVLEGMAIAGWAVGASQGYIYARGESPLAIERLTTALQQAEREGLLGHRVLGHKFQFRIDLRIGAGAYVCGEETSLIASIEGQRGQPRPRPPYPPERGLWEQPTLINNVETFAAIPSIILNGADWYRKIGSPNSPGTKVFALAGRIVHTGLVEVPLGTTLRKVLFEMGGGIAGGHQFKAAQTGGPAGGCIPSEHLDLPLDYDSLRTIGSMMGSGGLIVLDSTTCMVDMARFFMEFCMDESCGKCTPCRAGTVQMHHLLHRITTGQGTESDAATLEELADLLKETSLCGLGQAAPNPVISTLRHFRGEYIAHIREHRCPAGSCEMRREVTV